MKGQLGGHRYTYSKGDHPMMDLQYLQDNQWHFIYTRHSCLVDAKFGIKDITALIQSHGQLYLPNNTGRIDGFVSSMRQNMGTRRHLRISKTQDRKPAMISKAHQTRTLYIISLSAPKYIYIYCRIKGF